MAFSQFDSVELGIGGSLVHAHGGLAPFPAGFKVAGFLFAIVQGDAVVGGPGTAGAGGWTGQASGGGLAPGDALGVGMLLLVDPGATPGIQAVTWSEAVLVE